VMLSGCPNPDSCCSRLGDRFVKPFRGTPHEEVGQTHVAVLSVTRWDDYRRQLQPTFELTEDKALKSAMADTLQTDQSVLDAFAAQLGLKLAPSGALPAGFKDKGDAGEETTEPNAAGAHGTPGAPAEPNGLGVDPHLAYLAATALYQEVKLLNRYIADAAIPKGYKAYVVRTQIASMPHKRGLSYDTYVDLSFFPAPPNKISEPDPRKVGPHANKISEPDPRKVGPRVIPLLVTDQVEAALLSRRAETLRQVALALSAAYAGIGGKVNVDRLMNTIESSLGRNYNSLLTVGRLSNNTLRVRLGARQSPGTNSYEMVAQTHNVSLLLLVPESWVANDEQIMCLVSRTRFSYCVNGQWVPVGDVGLDQSEMDYMSGGWWEATSSKAEKDGLHKALSDRGVWDKLWGYAANEDYEAFSGELKAQEINGPALINRMWFDISLWASSSYQTTEFSVPKYPTPAAAIVGDRGQTAILVDDGKTTTATIIGIKDIDPEKVSAVWRFRSRAKAKWSWWESLLVYPLQRSFMQQYAFAATSASLTPGERNLIVTFPSLVALDLTPEPSWAPGLCLDQRSRDGDNRCFGTLRWIYQRVPAAKQKARITVQVVQEQVQASVDEKGVTQQPRSLLVGFVRSEGVGKKDDITGYKMAVSGALVQKPGGSVIEPVPDNAQVYTIKDVGQVTLSLTELVAGQTLKLTFVAPAGYESPPAKEIKIAGPAPNK
jgi:hypothetical protein